MLEKFKKFVRLTVFTACDGDKCVSISLPPKPGKMWRRIIFSLRVGVPEKFKTKEQISKMWN